MFVAKALEQKRKGAAAGKTKVVRNKSEPMATRLSDRDMAVAAAYASGDTYKYPAQQQQQQRPRARSLRTPMREDESDLPNIDDLQIAAGAAAGKEDPVWPVLRKALGEGASSEEDEEEQQAEDGKASARAEQPDEEMQDATSQDEDEDSESEEESSEEEVSDTSSSSSDDEIAEYSTAGPLDRKDEHVDVGIQVDASGLVKLQLVTSTAKEPANDIEELRAELECMEHGEDAEDAQMQAGPGTLPSDVPPFDAEILPDDVLLPIGRVSAVIGPTIVVQAPENGRAVSEGTPLCLGDRAPVGRVEDVFGPVMEPLYSLRFACGPSMPTEITEGAELYSIERLTDYILPQELYIKGYDKAEEDAESEAEEDEVDEFEFSDDESEAAWRRKQRAAEPSKRKTPQAAAAMPHQVSERGRSGSQRGRFDGQARGQGRGRSLGSAGGERGRGRGQRSRGRGAAHGGREGWNGHPQGAYGQNSHQGGQEVYAGQQQMGFRQERQLQYAQQHQDGGAYSGREHQQQQQIGNRGHYNSHQPPQQLTHAQQRSSLPPPQMSSPGGTYMQAPPSSYLQHPPSNHNGLMQQAGVQWSPPVQQNREAGHPPLGMHLQSGAAYQQQPWMPPPGQAHAIPAPQQFPQHQQMQYQPHPHLQQQQYAVPIHYDQGAPHQHQPPQQQMQYQGQAEAPSIGVMSSPATNAYLARLHGRSSKQGQGQE